LADLGSYFPNIPYAFIGTQPYISRSQLRSILASLQVPDEDVQYTEDVLMWFSFFGVVDSTQEERYAYEFQHNLHRMLSGLSEDFGFVIHPAFRKTLSSTDV
jgi:hypothetical protein